MEYGLDAAGLEELFQNTEIETYCDAEGSYSEFFREKFRTDGGNDRCHCGSGKGPYSQ